MNKPIDTDVQRALIRNDEHDVISAQARILDLCDELDHLRAENDALRVVRDAAQRVVDGDWRADDLDVWDALGMVTAALEADRG